MTEILPGCEPFSVKNGPLGVLVLHGFTGNPTSMRPLAERLAAQGYSVELPRLPGHGTSVEDMMTTDWSDWSGAALEAYDELAQRSERIGVVGLSMGGGLTAFLGEQRSNMSALVYINPLVKPLGDDVLEGIDALLESGVESFESIGSDIKKEGAAELSYSATPLACAKSLFAGVKDVHENLSKIKAPGLLLSSRDDHVVPPENGDDLVALSGAPIERIWLDDSYHVATIDNDQELVEKATIAFFDEHLKS